jgi:hypothetical protein
MQQQISTLGRYEPVAVYYDLADSVEYVRRDEPCVYRRIDDQLTLAMNMDRTEIVGFRLKGFKNFYLRELKPICDRLDTDFVSLVTVVERVVGTMAVEMFDDEARRSAYKQVREIAREDGVNLHLPLAA